MLVNALEVLTNLLKCSSNARFQSIFQSGFPWSIHKYSERVAFVSDITPVKMKNSEFQSPSIVRLQYYRSVFSAQPNIYDFLLLQKITT